MEISRRYLRKWTPAETRALQREFEILQWSIDEIAKIHGRTVNAIMLKLDKEGYADFNVLFSNYHDLNSPIPVTRKPPGFKEKEKEILKEAEDEAEDHMLAIGKRELDALTERVNLLEKKLAQMQNELIKSVF